MGDTVIPCLKKIKQANRAEWCDSVVELRYLA